MQMAYYINMILPPHNGANYPVQVLYRPATTLLWHWREMKINIFGGYYGISNIYSDGAKYNLSTNTWTTLANMPVASLIHSSCSLGNEFL